jgi:hypothetical protein
VSHETSPQRRAPTLVPLADAAHMLGLTYQRAHNCVLNGQLEGKKVEARWYVYQRAIHDFRAFRREAVLGQKRGSK